MARKLSAVVEIGATLAGTFEKAFGNAETRINQFGSSLKGFKKAEQDIRNLVNAQSALKDAQDRNNKELKEYNALLRLKNMKRNDADTKKYNANLEAQRKKLEESGRAVKRQKNAINELGASLRKAGIDTRNLSRSQQILAMRSNDAQRRIKMLKSIQGLPLGAIGGRILPALMMKFPKFGNLVSKFAPMLAEALPLLMEAGLVVGAIAAAVGAVGYAIFKLGKGFSDWADDARDASEGLNMSLRSLIELRAIAGDAGISVEAFDNQLNHLQNSLQNAVEGTGKEAKALQELGLDAQTLQSMGLDESLTEIAEAFKNYQGNVSKASLGADLFGKKSSRLIGVLNKGKQGIKEYSERLKKSGLIPSDDDLRRAEEFDKTWHNFQNTMLGVRNSVGAQVLPAMNELFRSIDDWLVSSAGKGEMRAIGNILGVTLQSLVDIGPTVIKSVMDAIPWLRNLTNNILLLGGAIEYFKRSAGIGENKTVSANGNSIYSQDGTLINPVKISTPTKSSSNSSGSVYNQDIQIIVNGSSGMNEAELAKAVKAELENKSRAETSGELHDVH